MISLVFFGGIYSWVMIWGNWKSVNMTIENGLSHGLFNSWTLEIVNGLLTFSIGGLLTFSIWTIDIFNSWTIDIFNTWTIGNPWYCGWLQTPAPVGNYWDSSEAQEPVVIGLLKEAHPRNSIIDKGLTWYRQCSDMGVSEDGGRWW